MPTDATVNSASTIAHNATQNFRRYWAGEGSLADAYWGYGFGGGWILALLLFLIGLALFPSAVTHYNAALASPVFRGYLVFARLTLFAYQSIVCILIWRNAKNASIALWKYVARTYVIAYAIVFLLRVSKSI
jgi:hypothetical protein